MDEALTFEERRRDRMERRALRRQREAYARESARIALWGAVAMAVGAALGFWLA